VSTPAVGAARAPRIARIVNPTTGFPRTVQDASGLVTIPAKPMRIHTLSVGYDEITFRLVDPSRIVAVGRSTANPDFSNVAELAGTIPNQVDREAERIVALKPDLVVASPFASPDLLAQLRNASVPLVVADLVSSANAHEENIRFLAYLYGEEAQGEALIQEVRQQLADLAQFVGSQAAEPRPNVLLLEGTNAAGSGTNEDGVLRLAGARNAAAEAGLSGNKAISLEAIPVMDPDWIVLADPGLDRPSLGQQFLQSPALQDVRAIRTGRVIRIKQSLVNTLSQWNVVGATDLAHRLYGSCAITIEATPGEAPPGGCP
jgi:iron complex transport system substrate-binding protein